MRGYGDYLNSNTAEYKTLTHWIRDLHVGGMIIADRVINGQVINAQPFEMAAFLNQLQRVARTPLLFASDFERGASMRVAETPRYPYFMARRSARSERRAATRTRRRRLEARALGIIGCLLPMRT